MRKGVRKKINTKIILICVFILISICLVAFNLIKPKMIDVTVSPMGKTCYLTGQYLSIDKKASCYNSLSKEVKLKLDFKGNGDNLSGVFIRAWGTNNHDFLIYNKSSNLDARMISSNYNEIMELPIPSNIYVINVSAVQNLSRISAGVIARWSHSERVCDLVADLEINECPPS